MAEGNTTRLSKVIQVSNQIAAFKNSKQGVAKSLSRKLNLTDGFSGIEVLSNFVLKDITKDSSFIVWYLDSSSKQEIQPDLEVGVNPYTMKGPLMTKSMRV